MRGAQNQDWPDAAFVSFRTISVHVSVQIPIFLNSSSSRIPPNAKLIFEVELVSVD